MPIPPIAPYAMPRPDELAGNRVSWRARPERCALLVHDTQRYFLDAYRSEEPPIPELYRNIESLRIELGKLGIPVVYSAQPGSQDPARRGLLADFWGPGMGDDPSETAIVGALAPNPDDIVLTKWRYSAFQRTDLAEILRWHGRDQLVITGVYAHLGCLTTACEAFMRDTQPFFVADAMADFSRDDHMMALNYAARRCATVTTTSRLLRELPSPS